MICYSYDEEPRRNKEVVRIFSVVHGLADGTMQGGQISKNGAVIRHVLLCIYNQILLPSH